MKVKLEEPCVLEGVRYEAGDVVEVSERTQELNAGWMKKAKHDDELTEAGSRPLAAELAAAEKDSRKAEREDKKDPMGHKASARNSKAIASDAETEAAK